MKKINQTNLKPLLSAVCAIAVGAILPLPSVMLAQNGPPGQANSGKGTLSIVEPAWHDDQEVCVVAHNIRFHESGTHLANASPYYFIAPMDPASPQDVEGNDCVIRLPGDDGYKARTQLTLVLPGPNANEDNTITQYIDFWDSVLVRSVDLGDGNGMVRLPNVHTVEAAVDAGLVTLLRLPISIQLLPLPIEDCPHHG